MGRTYTLWPVDGGTTPLRRAVIAGARRLGLENRLDELYYRAMYLRGGPKRWRNARDDERARLVAACILRPDSNCIDVGANEGAFLGLFAELAPEGRHIAYEPVPALAQELTRRFPAVDVRPSAAADRRGTTSFVVHRASASRSSIRSVGYAEEETTTIEVAVEDIDSALPEGYAPDLIKIDVEGAEELVLAGARRTLAEHRPLVLFEHQHSTASHYGSGPDRIFDLLVEELGFRIFDLDGRGPLSREELNRSYRTGERFNFVATAS